MAAITVTQGRSARVEIAASMKMPMIAGADRLVLLEKGVGGGTEKQDA